MALLVPRDGNLARMEWFCSWWLPIWFTTRVFLSHKTSVLVHQHGRTATYHILIRQCRSPSDITAVLHRPHSPYPMPNLAVRLASLGHDDSAESEFALLTYSLACCCATKRTRASGLRVPYSMRSALRVDSGERPRRSWRAYFGSAAAHHLKPPAQDYSRTLY